MKVKKKYKGLKYYDGFDENPFLKNYFYRLKDNLKSKPKRISRSRKDSQPVVDKDGNPVGYSVKYMDVKVDGAQFVKLYKEANPFMLDLTKAGMKVLAFIISKLPPNKELIYFSYEQCRIELGYQYKKNVTEGILDLLEHNVLAKTQYPEQFYINPLMFFNGDLAKFLKNYANTPHDNEVLKNIDGSKDFE